MIDPSDSSVLYRGWPLERPLAASARGRHIETADGRRLLDGASGALSAILGYGSEEIAEAMARQVRELDFAHSHHFANEAVEAYAAELAEVLPGEGPDALSRVLLVTGGSEAIEMALLLAHRIQRARGRGAGERSIVLGRHLSYHGCTVGTLALGARHGLRRPVERLLDLQAGGVGHLPPPFPYRPEWHRRFPGEVADIPGVDHLLEDDLDADALERARSSPAAALEVTLEAVGPERVCAFVAEPVIGASAGAVVPPDDYWPEVRRICDRHGVLWIADEVMTGMGRTGTWLAGEHWDVQPDIVALGKGMGAGYVPLAATVIRERDWELLADGPPGVPHGFTYAHHPVGAAVGRTVLRILRERRLLRRSREIERRLRSGLREVVGDHPFLGDVRGLGAMIGVEVVAERESRKPFPTDWGATQRLLAAAEEAGVLLYPARGCADGVAGDAVLVAPALTIADPEVDQLLEAVGRAFEALREAWAPTGRP